MLGCMGQPALQRATPNIDRLASHGTVFEKTYCSHPICCPSRANMWSGTYTHKCESWNNYKGLEPGMWSLLDDLPKTHAFYRYGKLDYISGGHTQLARLSAWLGASGVNKPVFDKDGSQGFHVADDNDLRCHEKDWKKIDQAIVDMKAHKASGSDQPFFLYMSTGLVHAAFKTNRYWLDKIPEELVDVPPQDDSDHPVRQWQLMAKAWRSGHDEATVKQVRRIYMAMCAEADAMVGALYDAMQECGYTDDTYFMFSSDHGEMAMEHQDWYKMTMFEASMRVPLIISGPDIKAAQRVGNLVSLIDVCPTLMDMAGLEQREQSDGESLLPLAQGKTDNSRDWVYGCFMGCTMNTSAFMLRKGPWKYLAYGGGYRPQLFKLDENEDELIDYAESHAEVCADMDTELRSIVDYEQTHSNWQDYCKEAFRQWRRQAKHGLHVDGSYGLSGKPSTDYMCIMDNCFTGFDEQDEAVIEQWLNS